MGNSSAQKSSTTNANATQPAWAQQGLATSTEVNRQPAVPLQAGGLANSTEINRQPATLPQAGGMATVNETSNPAWANVNSDAYKSQNALLQTSPIAAFNQTMASGGQGGATQNAISQLGNSGGSNPWMNSAANSLQNVGQVNPGQISVPGQITPGNIGTGAYQNLLGQAGQGGAASNYLTQYANGSMLNGSPELQNIIDQTNSKVADSVGQMFAAGGRYGSGTNQGVLADSIANNTSNLLYNNYNQQQQNQMNAANALENAQQGRLGLGLNAASGLAGVQGQNVANSMSAQGQNIANSLNTQSQNVANSMSAQGQNAANQIGAAQGLGALGQSSFGNQYQNLMGAAGLENQGFGNVMSMIGALPTIQNNKVFDAQQQMGLGGQLDQASQTQLNDLINRWGQTDMQDWARLGGLLSAGTQSAGNWGTQNTTTKQPANILGAIGSLLTAPMTGGGSVFGSMFSDVRLKEDVKRVGSTDVGTPVYTYRYKGDPTYHMGVMAQEVADQPGVVAQHSSGFLMVDYSRVK